MTTWSGLQAAFAGGGAVTLGADIDNPAGEDLTVGGSSPVVLDLNGHELSVTDVGDGLAGVNVAPGESLVVKDTAGGGSLTTSGGSGAAGIGGNGAPSSDDPAQGGGSVTILSGTVTATGGGSGAGIGGGSYPAGNCFQNDENSGGTSVESVTIQGGTVSATGGQYAAGIGSSDCTAPAPGPVAVTGGSVSATGGTDASGVGGGYGGAGGSVTESGGAVTTTGGAGASGVGGGYNAAGGSVTVSGGAVTATGGQFAAGVGGGYQGAGGSLLIQTGGTVTANGGQYGAGVGGGYFGAGGSVTVSGGTVTATGGQYASGVGGGYLGAGGSVTVSGGAVTATGVLGGAGVGGGYNAAGGSVSIEAGGSVTAVDGGSGASAVGAGSNSSGGANEGEFGSLSNAGSLTIPSGATLLLPAGATAQNSGGLHVAGAVSGVGTIHNTGVIDGTGSIDGDGQGPAGTALLVDTNNYTLSFDVNGGSGSAPATEHVYAASVFDSGQTLMPRPTGPAGAAFTGWFTAAQGGTQVQRQTDLATALGATGPTSVTLFAHYASLPTVTGVSPAAGPTAGGQQITLTGTDFTAGTATPVVHFGSARATTVQTDSDTQLTVTTPAHTVGSVNVRVTTTIGVSAKQTGDLYRFANAPTVTAVRPAAGPTAGGTRVTISGTGFSNVAAVSFADTDATTVTVLSSTRLTVLAPPGSRGSVDVTVTAAGGTSTTNGAATFTYDPAPVLTSITPTTGAATGGSTVTLTGTGLSDTTTVTFGSTKASTVTVVSDTKVTVTAPPHAAGGVYVYLTTPGGTTTASKADRYTYTAS